MPKDWFFTPAEAAKYLGWDPHYIRVAAREVPCKLPFPVVLHGRRTQIPKQSFLDWINKESK